MNLKDLWKIWDRIWFTETLPSAICLFRIPFGVFVFLSTVLMIPDWLPFFGQHSIESIPSIVNWQNSVKYFNIFYGLADCNQDIVAIGVLITLLISSLLVTIGLWTRVSTIALTLCLISCHARMAPLFHSGDTLMRIQAVFLCFSPAGNMYSIDYWLKKRRLGVAPPVMASRWVQMLLRLHIGAIYCQTFLYKVSYDMWLKGDALYWCTRLTEYARFPVPYLFDHMWTMRLLTWGTLVIEFLLWTFVWIREFRYPILIAGIVFHLGIDWAMNLGFFEYSMIASYILFLEPEHADNIAQWFARMFNKLMYAGNPESDSQSSATQAS